MPYPSDVTDEEWEILEPLLPGAKPDGRPQEIERREILNAILYVLRSGCPWRLLPHDLPRWFTAYWYFRQWKRAGIWEQVNAALRREKSFDDMSYADWREIMDVTLDGAFHTAKACLPALRKSGAGTIVNIGGLSAHTGAKNRAHVVTAKAGIVGFTRALAHDLASDGITVNCVVPGFIGTQRPKDQPQPAHHLTHGTITGTRGTPEDVAAMVRFLCGPVARYITGQAIHANGGAYLSA